VESQFPKANPGPNNQEATRAQLPRALLDLGGQEPLEPKEVDASDRPPPLGRVRTIQLPMYYISEVLHDAKTRYLDVHKLLYTVFIASRKLRHYF
jgi:hypothetical protein